MRNKKLSVLYILDQLVIPPNSGGSKFVVSPILSMDPSETDIDIVCQCSSEEQLEKWRAYFADVQILRTIEGVISLRGDSSATVKPPHVSREVWVAMNSSVRDRIIELVSTRHYDIVRIDHSQMAWAVPYVRKYSPHSKVVLALHNAEYIITRRAGLISNDDELLHESELLREWEERTWKWFDAAVCVSSDEEKLFKAANPVADTILTATGGGIDTAACLYDNPSRGNDIAFMGTLSWKYNTDGLRWFINEVLPIVNRKLPDAKLVVAGYGKPDRETLKALESHKDHVSFLGEVKSDIDYFNNTKVFICPLFVGAGARVKITYAWACGCAVVSTTVVAEGLQYEDGKNIIIADDAEHFAESIVSILSDISERERVSKNGVELARQKYDVKKCTRELLEFYKRISGN